MSIKINGKDKEFILGKGTKQSSGDKIAREDVRKYLIEDSCGGKITYKLHFFESNVACVSDGSSKEEAINDIYDAMKQLKHTGFLLVDIGK